MRIKVLHLAVTVLILVLSIHKLSYLLKPKCYINDLWQMVNKSGYYHKIYNVTTQDGYVLTLHRFPNGKHQTFTTIQKTPVLMLHGMFGSGLEYLVLGPKRSLVFLLADRNYDVWLGNFRGSTWSRKHVELNPDNNEQFWNYSLHETGLYDIPAMIDHILVTTNQDRLHIITYSSGSLKMLITLSEKPDYAKKIRLMSAMSLAALLKPSKSLLVRFLAYFSKLTNAFILSVTPGYMPFIDAPLDLVKLTCRETSIFYFICQFYYYFYNGGFGQLDTKLLPYINSVMPANMSKFEIVHIHQIKLTEEMKRYDFGEENNLVKYGQEKAPSYNLDNAKIPVAIYYSQDDSIITPEAVEHSIPALPNVVKVFKIETEGFYHTDFLYGNNTHTLVYSELINEMDKY